MRLLAKPCGCGPFSVPARSSKPSDAALCPKDRTNCRPVRHKKTRKTAWLSQSRATVRVFSRGPNCRQEEWDLTKQEFVNEIARRADLSSRCGEGRRCLPRSDHRHAARRWRSGLHGLRKIRDPAARRAPGCESPQSDAKGDNPGSDGAQVHCGESTQGGRKERRGRRLVKASPL